MSIEVNTCLLIEFNNKNSSELFYALLNKCKDHENLYIGLTEAISDFFPVEFKLENINEPLDITGYRFTKAENPRAIILETGGYNGWDICAKLGSQLSNYSKAVYSISRCEMDFTFEKYSPEDHRWLPFKDSIWWINLPDGEDECDYLYGMVLKEKIQELAQLYDEGKIKEIRPFVNKYHIEGEKFNCFETLMEHVLKVFKYRYNEYDGMNTLESIAAGVDCAIISGEQVEILWSGKDKSREIINSYYMELFDDPDSFDEYVKCFETQGHKLIFT